MTETEYNERVGYFGKIDSVQSEVDHLERFILSLAERIFLAHEIIGKRAEKRTFVLTEADYCPLA